MMTKDKILQYQQATKDLENNINEAWNNGDVQVALDSVINHFRPDYIEDELAKRDFKLGENIENELIDSRQQLAKEIQTDPCSHFLKGYLNQFDSELQKLERSTYPTDMFFQIISGIHVRPITKRELLDIVDELAVKEVEILKINDKSK